MISNLRLSISGCLNEPFKNDEKVLLMRVGNLEGFKLSDYQGAGDTPDLTGCKSIVQVCHKLNLPVNINYLDILSRSIINLKPENKDIDRYYSEKRDLVSSSICMIGMTDKKSIPEMIRIILKINKGLSDDLLYVKKWSPTNVEKNVNKYY